MLNGLLLRGHTIVLTVIDCHFAKFNPIEKYNFSKIHLYLQFFHSLVPEEAPTSLKGYSINTTAIYISWKGISPSFHQEPLLGYRIKYRHLGSLPFSEMTVKGNVTEVVIASLSSETTYAITVNGFNVNGHGPSGEILIVKTLAVGKFILQFNICYTDRFVGVNRPFLAVLRMQCLWEKNPTECQIILV